MHKCPNISESKEETVLVFSAARTLAEKINGHCDEYRNSLQEQLWTCRASIVS
jgi:hypothetical protein